MVAELSGARHALFCTTQTHLGALNERLASLVSVIPSAATNPKHSDDDASSEASDPGELFHRDIGVQTSEPSSRASSVSNAAASDPVSTHAAKLQAIRAHLSNLNDSTSDTVLAMEGFDAEMGRMDNLLDDLRYARRVSMRRAAADGLPPSGVAWASAAKSDVDEDEIDRVKAEIKSVKGVLLSARSFPGAGFGAASRIGAVR